MFPHTQVETKEGGGYAVNKLSASGADIGGDCLFGVRLGFSGTPSDLIPPSMRPCGSEEGADAKIVCMLTDPDLVRDVQLLGKQWNVKQLLIDVANKGYNALIDIGAIITGFDNEQVARFVLEKSANFAAAVFLLSLIHI